MKRKKMARFQAVREFDSEFVSEVANHIFALYDHKGSEWNFSDSEQVWKMQFGGSAAILGVLLGGRTVCVKLFYDRRAKSVFRDFLRCSKAKRAYRRGILLKKVGIACPRMLGYAEDRFYGTGLVVTEFADEYVRVDHWIDQYGSNGNLAKALGVFIRSIHDQQVVHSDLSPRNILMKESAVAGEYTFLLIDYEDVSVVGLADRNACDVNLFHMYERMYKKLSADEREIFLRAYADGNFFILNQKVEKYLQKNPSKYIQGS